MPCFGTIRNNTALKLQQYTAEQTTMFWNHSKQHSSKTIIKGAFLILCFGTIRNNTALKPRRISFLPDFVIALLISA